MFISELVLKLEFKFDWEDDDANEDCGCNIATEGADDDMSSSAKKFVVAEAVTATGAGCGEIGFIK